MSESISNRSPRVFPGSSFRHTPLEHVRTILVKFVQGLFAAAPAGEYHWCPDEEQSEIIIRDENVLHAKVIGFRPAINFARGAIQFAGIGVDDMMFYQFSDEKKTKGILVPGVTTINVSSRSDLEADNVAWIVAEHLWLLRDLLLKQGFFEIGRGIVIAPPTSPGSIIQADSGDEWYITAISLPWQFARQSAFTPLGQTVVQSIETSISTGPFRKFESVGWPYANHELPVNIHECPPPPYSEASDAHGQTPDPAGTRETYLPRVPHPLDPSKTVTVRTVLPNRSGLRGRPEGAPSLPIDAPCVKK